MMSDRKKFEWWFRFFHFCLNISLFFFWPFLLLQILLCFSYIFNDCCDFIFNHFYSLPNNIPFSMVFFLVRLRFDWFGLIWFVLCFATSRASSLFSFPLYLSLSLTLIFLSSSLDSVLRRSSSRCPDKLFNWQFCFALFIFQCWFLESSICVLKMCWNECGPEINPFHIQIIIIWFGERKFRWV